MQLPIQTVYFDNNSQTHFRPLADSLKIYRLIFSSFFKYIIASLSSAVIDLTVFHLLLLVLTRMDDSGAIIVSTVAARVLSSLYNFLINRNVVFKSAGGTSRQALRYYALCVTQLILSAAFVVLLDTLLGWNKTLEKALVDGVLFLVSYQVQRIWVFREEKK